MTEKDIERVEAEYTNIPVGSRHTWAMFEILKALLRICDELKAIDKSIVDLTQHLEEGVTVIGGKEQ